jgi:predicted acylesterase/phospholipase RssA
VTGRKDVAVVLSGGGMNGVLMELGFLRRLRESSLWPRIGWMLGTSAGALSSTMAALERLDDMERFLLELRPEEAFRPQRLWRLPLLGLHEYTLPATIAERVGEPIELARALAAAPIEVVVCATDVTEPADPTANPELVYSAHTTPPEEFGQAVLASAAISALVAPIRVGDRIATDGAWVRNFPLVHAYENPEVELIVAFRLQPQWPAMTAEALVPLRQRLERFRRVPPIRAFIEELHEAEERSARGEPAHLVDMIVRLMRIAITRNTDLEERLAQEKDDSIGELDSLRSDLLGLVETHVRGRGRRERLQRAIEARFDAARFPFRHDRRLPRITVYGSPAELDIDLKPGFRTQEEWTDEAKRALIARGYELADRELRAHGVDAEDAAQSA